MAQIFSLKNSKFFSGLKKICAIVPPITTLKGVSKSVSKPLCILINRTFSEGKFPDTWRLANVIPSFKKGDKS